VPDAQELNQAKNFDHGWTVPILQSLFGAVAAQFPDRKISLVGFSLGTTIIRDAMRRMHRLNQHPFERVKDLVLISGANHGVKTFTALCNDVDAPKNPSMAGAAACQLGDLTSYVPVPFHIPNNGPDGAYEAPCVDGSTAYGQAGVCGGNAVQITTLVQGDPPNGTPQDEFVSQGSAALAGTTNLTVDLADVDPTGYFATGLYKNHYGALRSAKALGLIMGVLND
jgi:hypothetical protein